MNNNYKYSTRLSDFFILTELNFVVSIRLTSVIYINNICKFKFARSFTGNGHYIKVIFPFVKT